MSTEAGAWKNTIITYKDVPKPIDKVNLYLLVGIFETKALRRI